MHAKSGLSVFVSASDDHNETKSERLGKPHCAESIASVFAMYSLNKMLSVSVIIF